MVFVIFISIKLIFIEIDFAWSIKSVIERERFEKLLSDVKKWEGDRLSVWIDSRVSCGGFGGRWGKVCVQRCT